MTLTVIARAIVKPGGRKLWIGGLVKHRGHPFAVECGHRHETKADAEDCAETLIHAPHDSLTGEKIAKAEADE